MSERFYIAEVIVPPAIEAKIRPRGFTGDEIKEAVQAPARPERAYLDHDPEHGRRLIVIAMIRRRLWLKIVLQPVDMRWGTYRLRTAVVARSSRRA